MKGPAKNPCGSCPYRRDVPSGVWDASEYAKLARYDEDTPNQPPALFMCHQQDGRVCAGWCGTHDMDQSLALRFAAVRLGEETVTAILDYESPVPLFRSGGEAATHGLRDIDAPGERAGRVIGKLEARRDSRSSRHSEP